MLKCKDQLGDIRNMEENSVWNDMPGDYTLDQSLVDPTLTVLGKRRTVWVTINQEI